MRRTHPGFGGDAADELIPDPNAMLTSREAKKLMPADPAKFSDEITKERQGFSDAIDKSVKQLQEAGRSQSEIRAFMGLLTGLSAYLGEHNLAGLTRTDIVNNLTIKAVSEPEFLKEFARSSVENLKAASDKVEADARSADEEATRLEAEAAKLGTDEAKQAAEAARKTANDARMAAMRANDAWARAAASTPEFQAAQSLNSAIADAAKQEIGSGETSLDQVAAGFKKIDFQPGTVNLDLGGGKFDKGTEYLAGKGVTNLVYDPVNRSSESNQAIFDAVKNGGVDTVTCNNVLNVIKEEGARSNVILQAAKALKPGGVAYFTVYEGDGSGNGHETSKGWQEHRKTVDYMDEIKQHFGDVVRHGKIIEARNPQTDGKTSAWFNEGFGGAPALFQVSPVYTGSAADYAQPDIQYVGTGEGAQVYGYGLYGSSDRGVAEWYARMDAKRKSAPVIKIRGKEIRGAADASVFAFENYPNDKLARDVFQRMTDVIFQNPGRKMAWIIDDTKDIPWKEYSESPEKWAAWEEKCEEVGGEIELLRSETQRNLYKQTFWPNKNENLLDWEENISEDQANQILDALAEEHENPSLIDYVNAERGVDAAIDGVEFEKEFYYAPDVMRDYLERYLDFYESSGESVYKQLSGVLGSPKAASEFLYRAGIDGVTYIGDSSGVRNYVAFSGKDIRVDEHIKWQSVPRIERPAEMELSAKDKARVEKERAEVRAKYEGTDQWMKAPNGEPTNLTEDQWVTVRTEAFKEWFGNWEEAERRDARRVEGDSAPVTPALTLAQMIFHPYKYFTSKSRKSQVGLLDENGEPLVVYHGTPYRFTTFWDGDIGFHFGNREQASARAIKVAQDNGIPEEESGLYAGFLHIVNPLVIERDYGSWEYNVFAADLLEDNAAGKAPLELTEADVAFLEEMKSLGPLSGRAKEQANARVRRWLEKKGFDGIVYPNEHEGAGLSFMAFNRYQFKEEQNLGTFSEKNPNFYYQSEQTGHRGAITPLNEAWQATIGLFEGAADASTLVHETSHYVFDIMARLVESGMADERLKADYETLRDWATLSDEAAQKGYAAYLKLKIYQLPEINSEKVL